MSQLTTQRVMIGKSVPTWPTITHHVMSSSTKLYQFMYYFQHYSEICMFTITLALPFLTIGLFGKPSASLPLLNPFTTISTHQKVLGSKWWVFFFYFWRDSFSNGFNISFCKMNKLPTLRGNPSYYKNMNMRA